MPRTSDKAPRITAIGSHQRQMQLSFAAASCVEQHAAIRRPLRYDPTVRACYD